MPAGPDTSPALGRVRRATWPDRLPWCVLVLSVIALLIGPLHFGDTRPRILPPVVPGIALDGGAFKPEAVNPNTDGHQRLYPVATRGSWIGGGDFTGEHTTGWFAARRHVIILVAGYPHAPGNSLVLEAERRYGTVRRIAYEQRNPTTTWEPWFVSVPEGSTKVRIKAVDGSTGPTGWLAFTEPYTIRTRLDWQALAWLQLAATTALAMALLYGPGLLWLQRRETPNPAAIAGALLIGPLCLVALGLLVWAAGGIIAPALCARLGVIVLLLLLARRARDIGALLRRLPPGATAVMGASAALAVFGIAKANVSIGAPGELYGGLVSRSLEVGGHSDSRVPFHVVQVVANHLAPFGPVSSGYFAPWSFASRGPLAGLVASPVVLGTGAKVPRDMPDQPWRPFDAEGFAAYRITLLVLASLAAWAIYGVVGALLAPRWGLLCAALTLLTPFFVHELYFTWPKLIATGTTLYAFLLVHRRQAFAGGAVLGVAYLFHPLPLLSAPFLAAWVFGCHVRERRPVRAFTATATFGITVLAFFAGWQLFATIAAGSAAQAGFLQYFRMADNNGATWASWWLSRWHNVANTFVPFYLLLTNPAHESLNSVYAPSPGWVRAGFLYWNTLPFALGFPGFVFAAWTLVRGFRQAMAPILCFVVSYALLLVCYWGAADTGMMRHCGQVLFVTVPVVAIFAAHGLGTTGRTTGTVLVTSPGWCALRSAEILLMAFGTTLANGFPHPAGPFAINDLVSFAIAVAAVVVAAVTIVRACRP